MSNKHKFVKTNIIWENVALFLKKTLPKEMKNNVWRNNLEKDSLASICKTTRNTEKKCVKDENSLKFISFCPYSLFLLWVFSSWLSLLVRLFVWLAFSASLVPAMFHWLLPQRTSSIMKLFKPDALL